MIFSPYAGWVDGVCLVGPDGDVSNLSYGVDLSYGNVEIYISVKHKYMTCCCNSVGRVSNF